MPYHETLDSANSSILHTRFKLCKKLISQKNYEGKWGNRVEHGNCILVLDNFN